jgi:hypothetical protein
MDSAVERVNYVGWENLVKTMKELLMYLGDPLELYWDEVVADGQRLGLDENVPNGLVREAGRCRDCDV